MSLCRVLAIRENGSMGHRICPWWLGYLLASPVRRLLQKPEDVVAPYIEPGMTVLEPGPGMGFFTLELAHRVGATGRIIAVDVQPKMVAGLERRLGKNGLRDRVEVRLALPDSMNVHDLAGRIDFTLAFAVVHEMPSAETFFAEVAEVSKPGAGLLLVEPAGHVTDAAFKEELQLAARAGFTVTARPTIKRSHAALLQKDGSWPKLG
jgi:ubiquinone/menaquinone biosynthesis C-methylase UbiE